MEENLKTAIVTGGARRIGAAICRRLHEKNINLLIHYNSSKKEVLALQSELCANRKNSVQIFAADLTKINGCLKLIAFCMKYFGRLDILINNASTYYPTEIGKITTEHWEDLLGINLKAPLFLSQAAAPFLKKTKGSIINITDSNIDNPKKGYSVYSIAKAGLINLTKSLSQDLAPEIRVNSIAPGPIIWPDSKQPFDENYKQIVIKQTLLKRTGEPNDIAQAVEFILAANYITGHNLKVDGGRSIST